MDRRARRVARTSPSRSSFFERYRTVLLAGFAVIGVALVAVVYFSQGGGGPWTCSSQLTPGPSDAAGPGFTTTDMGHLHQQNRSASISYAFCPPTSGMHYSSAGFAPLTRPSDGVFTSDQIKPGQWVHNLEHGYVVLAYKGAADATSLAAMRQTLAAIPASQYATNQGLTNRVIAVRFDTMDVPFAVLAWDRALLLPAWDAAAVTAFANQWQDHSGVPEPGYP